MEERPILNKPIFTISLDVELLWGYILYPQHKMVKVLQQNKGKSREVIDGLLQLFEKYDIPVTWAVVGHLFLAHCEKENGIPHRNMPQFRNDWYSWDPCTDIQQAPLFYGKDIVEKILLSQVRHEIGYHSFSHVPFSECNQEVAEAEIQEGMKLAKKLGVTFKSFVFPENKIGHIDILKRHGFQIYRGPNLAGKNVNRSLPVRVVNFALSKLVAPPAEPIWRDEIWEIPSSMVFWDLLFPQSLVFRAKSGVQKAIRERKTFHIFTHLEDFIAEPGLLNKLEQVLRFVSQKREEKKLQMATMGQLASLLNQKRL